jgi:ABC-2 type transport system ATP-binding protein
MDTVVSVQNLTKRYGSITAVDNISFEVNHGEIFGFLGPNGAGKTTTQRVLTGLTKPTSGKVKVAGYDVASPANGGTTFHHNLAINIPDREVWLI